MLGLLSRQYRAWRSYDLNLSILNNNIPCFAKLAVAPATLIKIFGPPSWHDNIEGTSGTYEFEDINIDVFRIFDRYETKEFIKARNLKLKHPPYSHRGKSENMPDFYEFWKLQTPINFWVGHSDYADLNGFLGWVKEKIDKNEDIMEKTITKYGEIDYSNDYKKDFKISREYALFKHNKVNWD